MRAPSAMDAAAADTMHTRLDDDESYEKQSYEHEHGGGEWNDWIRIALVALTAVAVWFRIWEPVPRVSVLGVAGMAVGGWPIVREAWENLRERRMTMELSMTVALVAALAIGEFFTALMITAFVLVAEELEAMTVGRGRRAIRDLLDFLPSTATVRCPGGAARIPLAAVTLGDAVLVSPGERIPVDGVVRHGESYVDQSAITGESKPVPKQAGAAVYAGTINQSGALEIVVERLGRETSFGKIIEAVECAERSQAPVQRIADRYAGYLVYFALACAAVTFALTHSPRSTISVIIVAGACGIAAGTPLAILGAIGRAARTGAIIKGGRYLEALWSVDVVALDKTGTVTIGAPQVSGLHPAEGVSERSLLEKAAIAERPSEHPVGRAIVRRGNAAALPYVVPTEFRYVPGRGVVAHHEQEEILVGSRAFARANGIDDSARPAETTAAMTEVVVAHGGRFLGTICVADSLRPEARESIQQLRRSGIRTVLLTGDTWSVADAVAKDLDVDELRAELLPEQKVAVVRQFMDMGKTVAMVGDGVNDAPALASATVGVAMGAGTDVARESADIVLLGNDLSKFAETVQIARRTRGIIRFNFAGTIAVDAVGVALAAFGMLSPLLAAFIHVASEMTFILNSARLLPVAPNSAE